MAFFNRKKEELKCTDTWNLLEVGKNFFRLHNYYEEGRENYNLYKGKQWERLIKPQGGIEPITLNIIKVIVKFKINVLYMNDYKVDINPDVTLYNDETEKIASITRGLTNYINKMWEKTQTGKTVKSIIKSACINTEGIIHFWIENNLIESEEIDKNNIYFGNESEENIQKQPYILVTFRKSVEEVKRLARKYRDEERNSLTDEQIDEFIVSDIDYYEEQGQEYMTTEISPMCNIVMKYKRHEDGKVYISASTRLIDILEEQSTERKLYPFAHFVWDPEKGTARGCSEIQSIKNNQYEINKTATRRAISVLLTSFPKVVVDKKYVKNSKALSGAGGIIELYDMRADDVRKVVSYLNPTSISSDATNLQNELMTTTRELAGAGDTATGNVDPTEASGKAILAVQNATKEPLNEQLDSYKYFLEDCAKIQCEMIKVNFVNGLTLYTQQETIDDMGQTQKYDKPFIVTQKDLEEVEMSTKIDITPQTPYDRLAREMTLENFFMKDKITLDEFVEALSENSSYPKDKLITILTRRADKRNKIAQIQQKVEALYGAVQQEMISQEGAMSNEMSQMQNARNDSGLSQEQQIYTQM